MFEIKVEGEFEAAHRIVDYPGKCDRLHGHNWKVEIQIQETVLNKQRILIGLPVRAKKKRACNMR